MAIQTQLYTSNAGPAFPLCGSQSQDLMIDNNLSCFNFQPNHHQKQQVPVEEPLQQLYNYKQRNQNINHPSTPNSQSLPLMFHNQWAQVDHLIRLQNEKLRIVLQEQRKQQVAEFLKKVELDALYVLSQKDEQIEQAARKRAELEEFLTKLEAENESWRKAAQENEAMVFSLHNTLEEMKEKAMVMKEGTGENSVGEAEQITRKMNVCNNCNSRSSSIMFLPCRHLCSCKACEPFLQACPVCKMPKKSSIETLIF